MLFLGWVVGGALLEGRVLKEKEGLALQRGGYLLGCLFLGGRGYIVT